ncbi:hypothetical protein K1719_047045 [Acacia pycnantha]|nr:hypothetical protein K1719_047045 [Acacia pycnantha]
MLFKWSPIMEVITYWPENCYKPRENICFGLHDVSVIGVLLSISILRREVGLSIKGCKTCLIEAASYLVAMDDSGSGEITVDVATDGEMPNEMMADISEHRQSSAFSRKVKRELMEMQMRDDMAFLSNKETRDLMKILKSSSADDVQFRGNQNMREMMERQFSSSVDDMPFCGNVVHIMDCELYKVVRDRSTDADKFVDVLEQVFTRNKVDLATIFFDHVTPTGDSLLHVAAEGGSEQVLCLIAFHYPKLLYKRNLKGDTPLHVAARFGNVLAMKNILDMDKHFMTSFDEEEAESVDKVEFIMLRNIYGRTALHEAVFGSIILWFFSF